MPRQTDPVWNNFEKVVTVGKTGCRAKCKSCDKTFGLVHSKVRNRLGVEKAGKLVFIYKLLNSKK